MQLAISQHMVWPSFQFPLKEFRHEGRFRVVDAAGSKPGTSCSHGSTLASMKVLAQAQECCAEYMVAFPALLSSHRDHYQHSDAHFRDF